MSNGGSYFTEIWPGILLAGRFGWLETGSWLFIDNTSCVVLEMPDHDPDAKEEAPWSLISRYVDQHGLDLRFMTCTHAHLDHVDSFREYHRTFPRIPIIWHESFFNTHSYFGKHDLGQTIMGRKIIDIHALDDLPPSIVYKDVPIHVFSGFSLSIKLKKKFIHILYVPKHSRSDTMIAFNHAIITGDWYLGPGDPNPNHVKHSIINASISRLQEFNKVYPIQALFSVHANEFRRGEDFHALMESTRP